MADNAQPGTRLSDLGVRTMSAAVMIPAVILGVWVGGGWFIMLVALIGVLMAHEWTHLVHRQNALQFALHAAAAVSGAILPLGAGLADALAAIAALWAISAAVAHRQGEKRVAWPYLGVPYVSIPPVALVLLRHDDVYGTAVILWILVIVWAADTLAYFAGRLIGGPRLAPVLSPKKTWAGLAGAVVGSALASSLFGLAAGLPNVLVLSGLAGGLALVEQAGDLFKSALKRHYGVKDSGRLIPGHGGVIDRVDGLVAVATAAAIIGLLHRGFDAIGRGMLVW
jgi:phosphatidate cytidylyltransferase